MTRASPGDLEPQGFTESRRETDEEVPAGGLRGTRYQLTARGEWRRLGLLDEN